MNERLLDITCCPVTHQPLRKADRPLLESLNAQVAEGTLMNAAGEPQHTPLTHALVTRDGQRVYPIRDGLVVLMADAAIVVEVGS
ncbi:MAG: Trm112 family protein [Pseudomonadota bacterium]